MHLASVPGCRSSILNPKPLNPKLPLLLIFPKPEPCLVFLGGAPPPGGEAPRDVDLVMSVS